ncbi:unnamed protein product [Camellia sinensis]
MNVNKCCRVDRRLKQSDLEGDCGTKQSRRQTILSDISISIWQRNFKIAKAQNMAEMMVAGALLSASFQVLFERLSSPQLLNFFKSLTHHNEGDKLLKKLKSKLLRLSVVLNDAEKQQFTNQLVKDWMDELKDAIYHADDLLDEIATKALGCKVEAEYRSAVKNQVTTSTSTSTSDSSLYDAKLVSQMEEIIERLECFLEEKDDLGLKEVADLKWSHSHRLPSTSLVDESGVYGRDDDKEKIIKILLLDEASSNKIDVIPIIGMGGIGKTTLAQLVYNDGRVVEHFDMKAWVCVSDEFDVLRVTKTILEAITSINYDTQDLNLFQVKLKESLMGKKFLIVLDDVWNENRSHWEILWTPFTAGAYGSKIVATTRNHSVASIMQTIPVHHLQHLSNEDCWLLFAKISFDKGESKAFPKLEKIGKQIVDRCKGLPLASKTLASLLRSKLDVEEWDEILKSDIWDLPEDKNNILPALRLSYHYLPSHLKQCFAFCSTFPKGYEFEKEKLVSFWIALNYVQQPRNSKTLEKIGEEYFHELLSRSFFQQSRGSESFFVMHDLVHDLAQVVHGQFSFRVDDKKLLDISPKARHFAYKRTFGDFEKFKAINEAKYLRSILQLKFPYESSFSYLPKKVLDDIFPAQRCLRLLSLPHYYVMDLHDSIGKLIHLRYLDLSATNLKKLPEVVCTLYNLQTLLLSNCYLLTTLPMEIGKLIFLRHLDISGTNLKEMPMQMSRLKGLQHLTDFVVGKCSGSDINELKEFHNLRATLTISGLQNVKSGRDALEAKLKKKKHLEEIVLEWGNTTENSQNEREVLENLQPHKHLKCLTIKRYGGTRFPEWLGDHSYSNIVSLFLDECDHCFSLPPLGKLSSLKHLHIARMNGITKVGEEFCGDGSSTKPFQSLETLHFEEMLEWVEWYILGVEEFSQLKELCVIKCPKLVGGLPKHMPYWVTLEIRECSVLMTSLPRTSIANKLALNGCNGVELRWQDVSSLVKLEISNMPSLKELTPELHMLTNLQELIIGNCPTLLSFPDTGLPLMLTSLEVKRCEALDSLNVCLYTCLQKLRIENCSSLLSFAVGVLPITLNSIHISKCAKLVFSVLEEMKCCNSSLEELTLHSCGTLRSLPLGFFTKLQYLNITNFEILSIPNGHGLKISTSLESVEINECNSMVSCLQEALHAPNLKTFWVSNCKMLKLLPEGMHGHLPSLESLSVWNCPEIESFPEGGLPSNLRLLGIGGCKKLVDCRREWGLQRLPCLTEFTFGGSKYEEEDDVLESFLEEGLLPPTLTSLSITNLQNLKSINYQSFQHLTCLKELRLFHCPQLQSLPEEGLVASLSTLQIEKCPLLKPRCERDKELKLGPPNLDDLGFVHSVSVEEIGDVRSPL